MIRRVLERIPKALGVAAFGAIFLWPTVALLLRLWRERSSASEIEWDSARKVALLAYSLGLSAAGALVALAIAIPAAFVLTRERRRHASIWLVAATMSALLCPPMVFVFGWQRILGAHREAHLLTIVVWGLWSWPIAGTLLAASWLRVGQGVYESLLLERSPVPAFWHTLTGALRAPCLLSGFAITALLLNEYTVPHACGLRVYATELLAIATSSSVLRDSVVAALPIVAALAMLGLAASCAAADPESRTTSAAVTPRITSPAAHRLFAGALASSVWVIPTAALALRSDLGASATQALHAYTRDVLATLGVGGISGALAVLLAILVGLREPVRWLSAIWVFTFGFVPASLVGEAFIAAFNRPAFASIADHWPIVSFASAARFAWIPMTAALVSRRLHRCVGEQAAIDGAEGAQRCWAVEWPLSCRAILLGALCAAALACGESVATSLLRVPDYNPVPLLIIEKFHRFEDGLLTVLALSLLAIGAVVGTLVAVFAFGRGQIADRTPPSRSGAGSSAGLRRRHRFP